MLAQLVVAGDLPPLPSILPYLYHPCFLNGVPPPFGPFGIGAPGNRSMIMDPILASDKRRSVISELEERFGNPMMLPSASMPVFELQQTYSDDCEGDGKKENCIQPDGSGYYVVPVDEFNPIGDEDVRDLPLIRNETAGFFAGLCPWTGRPLLIRAPPHARSPSLSPSQRIFYMLVLNPPAGAA